MKYAKFYDIISPAKGELKMAKFKEEYKIIEDKPRCKPLTLLESIVLRREKFTKNFWKNGGEFKSPMVQNLIELGEITRTDAVDLEFFSRLNQGEKMQYFNFICDKYTNCIADYSGTCAVLTSVFAELKNNKLLINSRIDMAGICAVPEKYRLNYEMMIQHIMNEKYLRQKYLHQAKTNLELLDKSYFEDIDNLVAYRKALAKETIKLGIRLDNYSMELGGGKYLFFNKALSVVSDSLPKKYEKEIKSYKKDIRKLNAKLAREENMSDESQKIVLY